MGKKEEEEEEEEGGKNELTAEVALEEKRKAEEAQRQSDLESAKELFGGVCVCVCARAQHG